MLDISQNWLLQRTPTDTETGRLIVTRGYPSKGVAQNKCQNLIT